MMLELVAALVFLVSSLAGALPAEALGAIDEQATANGACDSPVSSCTSYAASAPARGETVIVIAWWAGQSLTAKVSDGVNKYVPVVGPTNVPGSIICAEVWYAVNKGSPTAFTVTLSGNSIGGAFDGIFIQFVSMTGLDRTQPLDLATVNTATGTGTKLSVTSGKPSEASEMMWGIFLVPFPCTPWVPGSRWTSASGQEAVSESLYQNISNGAAQTPNATANSRAGWVGFTFGLKTATAGRVM